MEIPMPLHLEKKGIRALGIAESFSRSDEFSTLAGVVMRSDLVIDGFALGSLQVSGSDASDSILALFKSLDRNDINALLLSGSVLSLYNIVDVDKLHEELAIPVIAISFRKSKANLTANIRSRFEKKNAEEKIRLLRKVGKASEINLETGYRIFIRAAGISDTLAKKFLDKFTLQGAVPEPIRVARLFAKSVAPSLRKNRKD
ncbi:MAG: endonuclease dU [Nitrososphaerales archaeon]